MNKLHGHVTYGGLDNVQFCIIKYHAYLFNLNQTLKLILTFFCIIIQNSFIFHIIEHFENIILRISKTRLAMELFKNAKQLRQNPNTFSSLSIIPQEFLQCTCSFNTGLEQSWSNLVFEQSKLHNNRICRMLYAGGNQCWHFFLFSLISDWTRNGNIFQQKVIPCICCLIV